ncbi:MAG: lysine exporter LysO family protein [Prevotellaceae bacterium]|nr:lysine exporter LysO family protein [Prevotellaceae bacterium]
MLIVIGLIFVGMLAGYLLRRWNLRKVNQVILWIIWLLLFILGVEVGCDERIMHGLHTLGLEALVLTLAATLGSVVAAWILWKVISKGKGGRA